MQVRTPAVAGMFYPKDKQELETTIEGCFLHKYGPGKLPPSKTNKKIIGIICPHAGYQYSGPIAANSYYEISAQKPDLVIIIGPNHWGIGQNIASMKECTWKTPMGNIDVDTQAAVEINKISQCVELDFFSHSKDHCLEVQIPMLQKIFQHSFKILPVILIDQSLKTALELGKSIARIAKNRKTLVIGSSDFTHYEPNDVAHRKDKFLIDTITNLNINKFYNTLQEEQISACGYGAIASTMIACKELGADKGALIKYATSGDISGEDRSVVGYASIVFS